MPRINLKKQRPTITQLADEIGVSRATVSRAFSKPHMLTQATVDKVLAAAQRLGYAPNLAARALRTGQYSNIGLIVPDIANPFFPPLIHQVQKQADKAGYCVFLGSTDELPEREDRLINHFLGQIEGMILVSPRLSEEKIRQYATELPVVLVNRDIEGIPRVLIDSTVGIVEAVQHLADLGHQRILYIAGPEMSWANKQRQTAVKQHGQKLGIETLDIAASFSTFEAGFQVINKVIDSGATAAIVFDDVMAQGLLAGLARKGIKTPEQFSVIGCDDVLGSMTYPPLTSISGLTAEAGKIAAEMCLELHGNIQVSDIKHVLETKLVIRETTAKIQ